MEALKQVHTQQEENEQDWCQIFKNVILVFVKSDVANLTFYFHFWGGVLKVHRVVYIIQTHS